MIYNDKKVLTIRYFCNLGDKGALWRIWEDSSYYAGASDNVYLGNANNIRTLIKQRKTGINNSETLYFGKSSEFPRFKLADSKFKRCIKIDKADAIVIGIEENQDVIQRICKTATLLEDENYAYLVTNPVHARATATTDSEVKKFDADPCKYIEENNLFFGSKLNKVYEGEICILSRKHYNDVKLIMDNPNLNIITDKDLDIAVNSGMEVLTEDDIKSICDMLDSADLSTVGIGLKLLCGYDVNKTPLTIRTMLGTRERLQGCSEWNSVGVQQVLKSINFKGFGRFPNYMYQITQFQDGSTTYDPYDASLCKSIYVKNAKQFISDCIDRIGGDEFYKALGINVTFDVS